MTVHYLSVCHLMANKDCITESLVAYYWYI